MEDLGVAIVLSRGLMDSAVDERTILRLMQRCDGTADMQEVLDDGRWLASKHIALNMPEIPQCLFCHISEPLFPPAVHWGKRSDECGSRVCSVCAETWQGCPLVCRRR